MLIMSSCKKDDFDKMVIQIEGIVTNVKTEELVKNATIKILTNGGEKTTTSNDFGYFEIGEDITVRFDQPIDIEKIEDNDIEIENFYYDFDITWSENNTLMTINPSRNLNTSTIYTLYINDIMNLSGTKNFTMSIRFYTE